MMTDFIAGGVFVISVYLLAMQIEGRDGFAENLYTRWPSAWYAVPEAIFGIVWSLSASWWHGRRAKQEPVQGGRR